MRHQAITEGTLVCLRDPSGLDEHGEPWAFGAGPFRVARIYRNAGRREPWIRLRTVESRSAADELPGSFRAKELRPATAQESNAAEAAFWAAREAKRS